jgi:hypothetical protein
MLMPRRLVPPLLLLVVLLAAGCGKSKTAKVEKAVSTEFNGADCKKGSNGWDYECRQPGGKKFGLKVEGSQPRFASAAVPAGEPLPAAPGHEAEGPFDERAFAICADRRRMLRALEQDRDSLTDRVMTLILLERSKVKQLAKLTPPEEKEAEFHALLSAAREVEAAAVQLRTALAGGDRKAARRAMRDLDDAGAAEQQSAKRLGLPICALAG